MIKTCAMLSLLQISIAFIVPFKKIKLFRRAIKKYHFALITIKSNSPVLQTKARNFVFVSVYLLRSQNNLATR